MNCPTIKNRLNRMAARLQLVQIEIGPAAEPSDEVLDVLDRGEITALEAAEGCGDEHLSAAVGRGRTRQQAAPD